jgi:hypothetical protein
MQDVGLSSKIRKLERGGLSFVNDTPEDHESEAWSL